MTYSLTPPVLKGTPTNTEQINRIIEEGEYNNISTLNLANEAFSGNQYSPTPTTGQVMFSFELDATTGRQKLKKIMVDSCFLSFGGFSEDESGLKDPETADIEATEWSRDKLVAALGQTYSGSINLCVYKDADDKYGYAFPAVEDDELMNKVRKLWLHSVINLKLSNSQDPKDADIAYQSCDNQLYMFSGEGGTDPNPYGTFQWRTYTENDELKGEFKYCAFQFGRTVYMIGTTGASTVDVSATTYWLKVPHSNPANATIDTGTSKTSDNTTTYIPLIKTNATGKILFDYRAMPTIPVWEMSSSSSSS